MSDSSPVLPAQEPDEADAVAALPPTRWDMIEKFVQRHRSLLLSSAAVIAAAGGGLALSSWLRAERAAAPPPATAECLLFRAEIDPETGQVAGPPSQLTPRSIERRDPPSISPDGKLVAYWYGESGKSGLAVMPALGGRPLATFDCRGQGQLTWLDSEELLYQDSSTKPDALGALSKINIKTRVVQPFLRTDLSTTGFDWQLVPSRNEVVYAARETSPNTREFKAYALESGEVRRIAVVENLTSFRYSFRVSPDGKWIAYGVWAPRGSGRAAEMHLMTIDGVHEKVLFAPAEVQSGWRPSGLPYDWSPNGKFILYDQFPGGFNVFEVATGKTWPVPGAADAPPHEWGLATWSSDGSFLVMNRYRTH